MFKDKRLRTAVDIDVLIKKSKEICKDIKIVDKEKTIVIQQNKSSLFDLLLNFSDNGYEEVYITAYRLNKKDIDTIARFVKLGVIKKIMLVISVSVRPLTIGAFKRILANKLPFKEINTHTKMMFLKDTKGNIINCYSSGNFHPSPRIEFTSLDNDKKTFNFYKNWIDNL